MSPIDRFAASGVGRWGPQGAAAGGSGAKPRVMVEVGNGQGAHGAPRGQRSGAVGSPGSGRGGGSGAKPRAMVEAGNGQGAHGAPRGQRSGAAGSPGSGRGGVGGEAPV